MDKAIIVQARMTSTRLPGKVMKKVKGKALLEYQIERMLCCKSIKNVIIATTENAEDDVIVDFCRDNDVAYFRGDENDVLSRYYEAAKAFNVDLICRSTSDCPLIDPAIIDRVVNYYHDNQPELDYVTCTGYPLGMSAEVFSFKILEEAFQEAKKDYEREHVTPYFYKNPFKKFKVGRVYPEDNAPKYRLTVDTDDDLKLVEKILDNLYSKKPLFSLKDINELMARHPAWSKINSHIRQKTLGET
ncbi:MAG: acylneuraminate cytidylyltransferase [Chlamydiales bacterium]|nr:glycosyltransferase family protein [Chlamydiales bacterium]NCF70742.1 acylneuraminate cytidylyltransferase [Chlamydiales bacterium]